MSSPSAVAQARIAEGEKPSTMVHIQYARRGNEYAFIGLSSPQPENTSGLTERYYTLEYLASGELDADFS